MRPMCPSCSNTFTIRMSSRRIKKKLTLGRLRWIRSDTMEHFSLSVFNQTQSLRARPTHLLMQTYLGKFLGASMSSGRAKNLSSMRRNYVKFTRICHWGTSTSTAWNNFSSRNWWGWAYTQIQYSWAFGGLRQCVLLWQIESRHWK